MLIIKIMFIGVIVVIAIVVTVTVAAVAGYFFIPYRLSTESVKVFKSNDILAQLNRQTWIIEANGTEVSYKVNTQTKELSMTSVDGEYYANYTLLDPKALTFEVGNEKFDYELVDSNRIKMTESRKGSDGKYTDAKTTYLKKKRTLFLL